MNEKPRGQFWSCQPDASLTGERPDVPSPFQVLQKPDDILAGERNPGKARDWFRRNIAIPALSGKKQLANRILVILMMKKL